MLAVLPVGVGQRSALPGVRVMGRPSVGVIVGVGVGVSVSVGLFDVGVTLESAWVGCGDSIPIIANTLIEARQVTISLCPVSVTAAREPPICLRIPISLMDYG